MTKRIIQQVPWAEVEPIVNLLKNALSATERELGQLVGLSSGALSAMRSRDKVRTAVKYALLGLATEANLAKEGQAARPGIAMTFEESAYLLGLLAKVRQSNPGNDTAKALLKKLAVIVGEG